MNDELLAYLAGLCIGVLLGILIGALIFSDTNSMRSAAIKHGCAEWVIDQKNGKTSFKWKENK